MSLAQKVLLCGVLCVTLPGCSGKSELGPATSAPTVDPKKLEDERRKSMEMGKLKNAPQAAPPAAGSEK
jgi:hypothetical protein